MKRVQARADALDLAVARKVMRYTNPAIELTSRVLTRCGDEKIIVSLAIVAWLLAPPRSARQRAHILKTLLAVMAVDHASKYLFAEKRPDRVNHRNGRKGVPRSGSGRDAFPSGHAIHLGALASALCRFHPESAASILGGAALIAGTRVVLLAHWLSDVLLGLTAGMV